MAPPVKRVGHILWVDSQATVRDACGRFLERAEFKVVRAGTAEEAVRLLEGGDRPAVVITEQDLPAASGSDLLHAVRSSWHFIPVLVYGAHMDRRLRARLLGEGAVAALDKPVDMPSLRAMLCRLTGVSEPEPEPEPEPTASD